MDKVFWYLYVMHFCFPYTVHVVSHQYKSDYSVNEVPTTFSIPWPETIPVIVNIQDSSSLESGKDAKHILLILMSSQHCILICKTFRFQNMYMLFAMLFTLWWKPTILFLSFTKGPIHRKFHKIRWLTFCLSLKTKLKVKRKRTTAKKAFHYIFQIAFVWGFWCCTVYRVDNFLKITYFGCAESSLLYGLYSSWG